MATKLRKSERVARQGTLARVVTLDGIGLHTGRRVRLTLSPAPADSGISFERTDLGGEQSVVAHPDRIISSRLCTVLAEGGVRVSTVEHLLAALAATGVDNARVALSAEEVPILDGSAQPFVRVIEEAGVRTLEAPRTYLRIRETIQVQDGDRRIALRPARDLEVDCTVDFNHPLVTDQRCTFKPVNGNFAKEIAPARTFGFLKDVDALKRAGLAQGGSLDNALVIDRFSVLNPGGLRFADEFVRHKVLDVLGDLALLGAPVIGRVEAYKSGHRLHHRLVHQLLERPRAFERVQLGADGEAVELPLEAGLPLPGLQSA